MRRSSPNRRTSIWTLKRRKKRTNCNLLGNCWFCDRVFTYKCYFVSFTSLQLQHFQKFDDTTVALSAITSSIEGKIPKPLKKLLKKISDDAKDTLLVADAKLGSSIKVSTLINFILAKYYRNTFRVNTNEIRSKN